MTTTAQCAQIDKSELLGLIARRQDLDAEELVALCLQYGRASKDARGRAKTFWVELKTRFRAIKGKGSRARKTELFGAPSFKAFLAKHKVSSRTVYYLLGGRQSKSEAKRELRITAREVAYLQLILQSHPSPIAQGLLGRLGAMHRTTWEENLSD